jgi:hypothetical protein
MTDLEIIKKCAEKMGLLVTSECNRGVYTNDVYYNPLTNDAQLMALIKAHRKHFDWGGDLRDIFVRWAEGKIENLNRAVCGCIARMP